MLDIPFVYMWQKNRDTDDDQAHPGVIFMDLS